jgi:hypothetical protein
MSIYMNYGDVKGESVGQSHPNEMQAPATVQLGEKNIGQVAERLGVSKDDLLRANPQINDPSNLKVGQEIHLPTHPTPTSESSTAASNSSVAAKDLPKAPLGNPIDVSVVKGRLDALSYKENQAGSTYGSTPVGNNSSDENGQSQATELKPGKTTGASDGGTSKTVESPNEHTTVIQHSNGGTTTVTDSPDGTHKKVDDDGKGNRHTEIYGKDGSQTIINETDDGKGHKTKTTDSFDSKGKYTRKDIEDERDDGKGHPTKTKTEIHYDENGHETTRTVTDGEGHSTTTDSQGHLIEHR